MSKLLLLICVGGLPCALCAQTNQASWANLSVLRAGEKIQVIDANLKKHSGTFVSVSEAAISYEQIAGEQTIQKPDVRSVKRMRTKRRLLNTVLLGGVGAGVGAGIGAATYHDNPCPPTAFVCLNGIGGRGLPTALGAAIGLVGGAIVGALLPNHEIIYRVNPP
jgi:hypothetical protein